MSRWTQKVKDFYENKSNGWAQLENIISELTSVSKDDPFTSSLMRLHKVFLKLDGIIKSLDGDFFPLQSYDTLNKNTSSLINTLNEFKKNRTDQNINDANVLIDNILLCLIPYSKISKISITSNMQSIKKYNDNVTKILDNTISKSNDLEVKINTLVNEINEKKIKITEFFNELFISNDARESTKQQIDKLYAYIKTEKDNINGFYNLIFHDDDNKKSIKSQLEDIKVDFENSLAELNKKISEEIHNIEENDRYINSTKSELSTEVKNIIENSNGIVSQLTDFYDKIFGFLQEDGKRSGGLKQEIDVQRKNLNELKNKKEEEFAQVIKKSTSEYDSLKSNIEKLLPGATSAGLASAFSDAKKSYKLKIIIFTVLFYVSIFALGGFGVWWISGFMNTGSDLSLTIATTGQLINSFLYKLPVLIPLVWLATFSAKRRNEYTRLQEEYEHKWALTSSYLGFKKQIDEMETDDNQLTQLLLKTAIETIGFNPSVTLSSKHDEKTPILGNLIDFMKKTQKENE